MRALARHMEHVANHPDGGELYQLIQDAVLHCREKNYVNGSCIAYLHSQLLLYTRDHTTYSAPMRLRARLIQQHLSLYLPKPGHSIRPQAPKAMSISPSSPITNSIKNMAMESTETPEQKPTTALETLRPPETDAKQNLNDLRQMLTKSMDEMVNEREAMTRQLSDATAYLKMVEAEREQLRQELNKARKRSRADEKPTKKALGLPKRDVLLRQIEAEVERVRRHGEPLALTLIDVENLDAIGEEHGPEAATAVLNQYTNEVLGRFRSYDMVARYNKHEFAVLLPNTDRESAMRALEKVSKRAKESHFSIKGKSFPLPAFGGVLTFYSPGEEPHQMLRRADEALVNLRLKGKRQLVVI
jgi:diguanylate cyclase (GGDEF)-like protein